MGVNDDGKRLNFVQILHSGKRLQHAVKELKGIIVSDIEMYQLHEPSAAPAGTSTSIRLKDYGRHPTPTRVYYVHYNCSHGANACVPMSSPDVEIGVDICGLETSLWGVSG